MNFTKTYKPPPLFFLFLAMVFYFPAWSSGDNFNNWEQKEPLGTGNK